jgi:hypothetical protein
MHVNLVNVHVDVLKETADRVAVQRPEGGSLFEQAFLLSYRRAAVHACAIALLRVPAQLENELLSSRFVIDSADRDSRSELVDCGVEFIVGTTRLTSPSPSPRRAEHVGEQAISSPSAAHEPWQQPRRRNRASRRAKIAANRVCARTMSQASAKLIPAPTATPRTLAITGTGIC